MMRDVVGMKRMVSIFLTVTLCFALVSCSRYSAQTKPEVE